MSEPANGPLDYESPSLSRPVRKVSIGRVLAALISVVTISLSAIFFLVASKFMQRRPDKEFAFSAFASGALLLCLGVFLAWVAIRKPAA